MSKHAPKYLTDEFAAIDLLAIHIERGDLDPRIGAQQIQRRLRNLLASVLDEIVNAHLAGQQKAEDNVAKRLGE